MIHILCHNEAKRPVFGGFQPGNADSDIEQKLLNLVEGSKADLSCLVSKGEQ